MNTLIVHPKDNSTTFLDIVYKDVPNQTLITGGTTKEELRDLIESHDRVMMMGHGSPGGLFSVGMFKGEASKYSGYIIDETMVDLLAKKDNSVFIWCNADKFVDYHGLRGFYSGMFISEVGEAMYCSRDQRLDQLSAIKLATTTQDEVDESNYGFVNIISKYINEDTVSIHDKVREEYGLIAENNAVANYNNSRLYKFL
jgi:hypothetical protein